MLISPAYAQDASSLVSSIQNFVPILLIFVAAYFLLFRPQQQRQKTLATMLAGLRRGDRIITAGGILATVARVKEGSEEIEVDLAPNVRVTVLRNTITGVVKPAVPVVANDVKN